MAQFGMAILMIAFVSVASLGQQAADLKKKNLSKAEWQKHLDEYTKKGFRVTAWDVKTVDDEPRYDLEMTQMTGPAWRLRSGLTAEAFESLSAEMKNKGYKLLQSKAYTVKGVPLRAALWEASRKTSKLTGDRSPKADGKQLEGT